MKAKDYAEIMRLPKEDRESMFEEEKKRVYAVGGEARNALTYFTDYFEKKRAEYFEAFINLPRDCGLKEYRAVHSGIIALIELKLDIEQKITFADRLVNESLDIQKDVEPNV